MENVVKRSFLLVVLTVLISIGTIGGCNNNNDRTWSDIRAERLAALEAFLDENQEAFDSFRTEPLAIKQDILNMLGFQMIVFRLFPEIFPDIWGEPEDMMSNIGLGPDPFDENAFLPLGMGFALSETFENDFGVDNIGVNYVTFTCMGCHSGKFVGPDGETTAMIGAPNPLGELTAKLNETVNDPRYTAEIFREALNEMPFGWVYGFNEEYFEQEAFERFIFNLPGGAEFFLEEIKFSSNQTVTRFEETIFAFTYDVPNPSQPVGMPGSLDVFSVTGASACNPNADPPCDVETVMPMAPAPADIPAAWQIDGRPRYQWDDSISNLIYREIAASLSVTAGDAMAINFDNVVSSGNFVETLPPYPYPFNVDLSAAERGEEIFAQACLGCHTPGNNVISDPEFTGTSPNRADVFTEAIVEFLREKFREACPITNPECLVNGKPPTPEELIEPTGGYAQIPLVGVWATAPYLHNGSVPTLYHLITGDRPQTFYRGNFTYDQDLVGFTWDEPTNPSGLPQLYDTTLDGYSNTGHTGSQFNGGINWDEEPEMLSDLLEYLKTL